MKRWLLRGAVALLALTLGGFLVAASGVMPITASSGHWPITAWFLHYAMQRSIRTHTVGLEAPPLDDPRAVLKGAGHYETGCRPCHGSPEERMPKVAQSMTPFPPSLSSRISEWEPEELFYIVKHGVKFTGMPAWPTQQRDDEVWTMVAFLLTLPALDGQAYRQLVHGDAVASPPSAPIQHLSNPPVLSTTLIASCSRCHGQESTERGQGAFPKLAGQRPAYLTAALHAYARGERQSGLMQPIAAGLSPEAIHDIAYYYSTLPPSPSIPRNQERFAMHERGKTIATRGIPRQRVPACLPCHDPSRGNRNPIYPELAGQYADYLVLQLELFQREHRGGSAYAHLMRTAARGLTSEQMRDVAVYFEAFPARQ
jgi:cytochrome c553